MSTLDDHFFSGDILIEMVTSQQPMFILNDHITSGDVHTDWS